jgi:hypothetical protein
MSGFSTYQANKTLTDELVTPYATRYLALFIADPTDDNLTANEVTGAWYARRPTGAWASPTVGETSNNNAIQFNAVTGTQITVSHWGIYDAATSGNLRFSFPFDSPRVLNVDDVPLMGPGDLVVQLL